MRRLGLTLFHLLLGTSVAVAETVTFSGSVAALCSLAVSTPGTLGISTDGMTLGSQVGVGVSGTITVLSIGTSNIQVAAPTRTAQPGAYNATGELLQVAYTGAGGLGAVNQAYTASTTQFAVGTIGASVLTVNNRIQNSNGFAPGNYTMQTVVTCVP